MANLVGYARVSSDGQKDNASLPLQRKTIEEYCRHHQHRLVAFYQDIESGATIEARENFQWAVKTVETIADGLIVYRLDRLTRRVLDGEVIKETFAANGKVLVSVMDALDMESETGEFMFTISSAVAELERKRINKRCREGLSAKKEAGGYYSGRPPYGYASYKGSLIEIPAEQEVIHLIESLFFEKHMTFTGIAAYLNNLGIKSKSGKKWYLQAIRRIINSETPIVATLKASGKLLTADVWEARTWQREDDQHRANS